MKTDIPPRFYQALQALFNTGNITFSKLLDEGAPYRFSRLGADTNGVVCVYYTFPSRDGKKLNEKRVPLSELVSAVEVTLKKGKFIREDFKKACPISASDGQCGFAVTGRILEFLRICKYAGRGNGFDLVDKVRAVELLVLNKS